MKDIFIIGSKGIPAKYGGFETFVEKLTEYKKSPDIKYHVSCMSDNYTEFEHNGARCFNVRVPDIGPAKAVYYDLKSLDIVYHYIKKNKISNAIVYILACRIGPFMKAYKNKFRQLNVPLFVNPDGHEWKRAKWNWAIRMYWKISEKLMIKNADSVICDSIEIEKYINKEYQIYRPNTTFIAYGATVKGSNNTERLKYYEWLNYWDIHEKEYYLVVGRFVAENNYETIIREFMKSNTIKSLIIVTNIEGNKFYNELSKRTGFKSDKRIKFVGTIYNQDLLYQVRTGAYGYIHGHEVGGTNPSLLEAMATTSLNILLDVKFNREVGRDSVLYFNKKDGNLARIIENADTLKHEFIKELELCSKNRIKNEYSWDNIVNKYEEYFLGEFKRQY